MCFSCSFRFLLPGGLIDGSGRGEKRIFGIPGVQLGHIPGAGDSLWSWRVLGV